MPVPFTCSSCGARGKAPKKFAGQRVPCPQCGTSIRVRHLAAPDDALPILEPSLSPPSRLGLMLAVPAEPLAEARDEGVAVICPICGDSDTVAAEDAGTSVNCRRCGGPLRVSDAPGTPGTAKNQGPRELARPVFRVPRSLLDVLAGGGLAFALLLVFVTDRLTSLARPANTLDVRVVSDTSQAPAAAKRLRLAVTPTFREVNPKSLAVVPWDDMTKLLREMGEGYRFDEVNPEELLNNPRKLDSYDVLFLTCAPGGEELKDVLAQYVSCGGTLYASDWRFDAVAAAFPEYVDFNATGSGTGGKVRAEVVDPALRELVGPSIPLRFNLNRWKTAAFAGPRVTTLLRGHYHKQRHPRDLIGDPAFAPLLVKFSFGKGTVIFTSFHNEKQNSELERKLLHYLVFSLVTADVHAQVTASIQGAGFAPQTSNLLSTPKDSPSIRRTYTNTLRGPLRFALGFRNEGAVFRLMLRAPDGRSHTWEGKHTVILEVPEAMPGAWTYTVTAVQLPYENFPFTLTVSEKK